MDGHITRFLALVLTAAAATAADGGDAPIAPHPDNPHYFLFAASRRS